MHIWFRCSVQISAQRAVADCCQQPAHTVAAGSQLCMASTRRHTLLLLLLLPCLRHLLHALLQQQRVLLVWHKSEAPHHAPQHKHHAHDLHSLQVSKITGQQQAAASNAKFSAAEDSSLQDNYTVAYKQCA